MSSDGRLNTQTHAPVVTGDEPPPTARKLFARIAAQLDARDWLFLIGGTLLSIGLGLAWAPLLLVTPGCLMIFAALWRRPGGKR